MLRIKSPADVQDLLDLALEISELEVCSWKEAVRRAVELTPRVACDVMNDVRYVPAGYQDAPIEAHVCWSIPPRKPAAVAAPVRSVAVVVPPARARVAFRGSVTEEWRYRPCATIPVARREQRELRRRGLMATVQFWLAAEKRYVG